MHGTRSLNVSRDVPRPTGLLFLLVAGQSAGASPVSGPPPNFVLILADGLAKNTLVLFTSDNGPSAETIHQTGFFRSAGPFRGHKRQVYEGGIRVPCLAWWPGVVSAGTVSDSVSGDWEVLATLAQLAGQPVPAAIDGLSLAAVLRGGRREREHEYL